MGRVTSAILLYDGDCGLCSSCARFVKRRIPTDARVEPWQSTDISSLGLTPAQCEEAVQWVVAGGARGVSAGPAAIAALLRSSSRVTWRVLGRLLGGRAGLLVAGPVYRWVSRHRHQLPGGTPECSVRRGPRSITLSDDNLKG